MRCRSISRSSALAGVLVWFLGSFAPGPVAAQRATAPSEGRLNAIVSDLKSRLLITSPIAASVVPSNALMMSVEPPTETRETFLLSVEASFLESLTDDELEAAVAHELGHVWIFTHHPFLQTEQLANDIAMRLVSRDALAQLYDRVWSRRGTKGGDIGRFLGPQPQAGLASSDADRRP